MIVLDASAALGIAHKTVDGSAVRELMCKGECVIAPALFQAEVANAMFRAVRHGGADLQEETRFMEAALRLIDEFVDMQDLIGEASSEAVRLGHSAYDMLYFVLARRRRATLVTLDRKLMKLCAENGVNCIEEMAI